MTDKETRTKIRKLKEVAIRAEYFANGIRDNLLIKVNKHDESWAAYHSLKAALEALKE